jgi:hypothetical protein
MYVIEKWIYLNVFGALPYSCQQFEGAVRRKYEFLKSLSLWIDFMPAGAAG